jgi:hypothetical protein
MLGTKEQKWNFGSWKRMDIVKNWSGVQMAHDPLALTISHMPAFSRHLPRCTFLTKDLLLIPWLIKETVHLAGFNPD